jgi:choline kinase
MVKTLILMGNILLLVSTASDYDSKNLESKNKRQVYQHDMVDYNDDVIDNTDSFDIDTPVDIMQFQAKVIL